MNNAYLNRIGLAGVVVAALAIGSSAVRSDTVYFVGSPPTIAQTPLFLKDAVPPLNMLVMGKDHKNYYEAYNDASDLDGDGALDVGYKPATINYYGYFSSRHCYNYETANSGRFIPVSVTADKRCGGTSWSGDFLNYLTTSRMDALRRVLYGGYRQVDGPSDTTLQGAFFPQDAHSWGKEYQSTARDGYDIADYAPLSQPATGKYHLIAVTTVSDNTAPLLRVLRNSDYRVWNWLSIEGPVANNRCFNSANQRVDCVGGGGVAWASVPGGAFPNGVSVTTWKRSVGGANPTDKAGMDALFASNATAANLCGTGTATSIDKPGNGNPFSGTNGCNNDNYLSTITGTLRVTVPGEYRFGVDGDDAVDVTIGGTTVAFWYGGHGSDRSDGALDSHSGAITLAAGDYTVTFRHEEGGGGDNWGLFWKIPSTAASGRDDYNVRVQVCPADANLRDESCKVYASGSSKPTGILHDYGETRKMYFGLITGSQANNLEGGVLRRNVSNFANEIDASTGQFLTGNGIANTLSRLRMIGGGYGGGTTNNLGSDSNWNWANGTGNCQSFGNRALANGECRMWGNPIAEMMFEGLRYFAGAKAPTARFSSGGATQGQSEETTMGLDTETWKDPYGTGTDGLSYPSCAKPFQTVISDINPSYDGDLPGSAFGTVAADAALPGFDASGQGAAIWNNEFGAGSRRVFIGDVNGTTDGAPTAKAASSFGDIRGLAPEEPTKNGTYYAASVARYGSLNDLNAAAGEQKLGVYTIALASPLPRIEFPVGGRVITLLPFAKTVSGTFGDGTRKPTNTIVDFYVERIVNLPGQPADSGINGGRPYAVFRINYEDVEQGNDHDMDAIVRYEVKANANDTMTVSLTSEYAAGSANQNMGYIIAGTTRDGIYLDVRDLRSTSDNGSAVADSVYQLNTPAGTWAGECASSSPPASCSNGLTLASTRTFDVSTVAADATQLQNPLWYAAKYGGFQDFNNNGVPDTGEWDRRTGGQPDNYFLVTNPLYLRSQLSQAFESIAASASEPGNATVNGARLGGGSFSLQPSFARGRQNNDWYGNLTARAINADGTLGTGIWDAQARLPAYGAREVYAITRAGSATGTGPIVAKTRFNEDNLTNLGTDAAAQFAAMGINSVSVSSRYGNAYTPADIVNYLLGDTSREERNGGAGNTLRSRTGTLGDIVNSEPVVFSPKGNFGYGDYTDSMFSGYSGTGGYLTTKATRTPIVLVGANDGMLHAFNAATVPCGTNGRQSCAGAGAGREVFAVIPQAALGRLGGLPLPDSLFEHRYYVDGQITVGDAKSGSNWKSLAIASMGAGGRSVMALDITNPTAVDETEILWEFNSTLDTDLGHVFGKPLLVPLENGRWGVVFGNGYGGSGSDPILYVRDAFTGREIAKIVADDGASTGLGTDPYNGLGQVSGIDTDSDGKVDTIYGGDLLGNLWKFDLTDSSASEWDVAYSGQPLFTASEGSRTNDYAGPNATWLGRQPITGGLRVAQGPGRGYMVYFGTGRYFAQGDNDVVTEPQVQTLYGVWDDTLSRAGTRTNLTAQTITAQVVDSTSGATTRSISQNTIAYYGTGAKRGWYVDLALNTDTGTAALEGTGERFIAVPRIQNGKVFFPTYSPASSSCDPGGQNFMYVLDLLTGGGSLAYVKVLPSSTPVCTNGDCGGIRLESGPPVTSTSAIVPDNTTAISGLTCVPGSSGCPTGTGPTFEECQVVIYPGALVLPRPCGRQSWRQVK